VILQVFVDTRSAKSDGHFGIRQSGGIARQVGIEAIRFQVIKASYVTFVGLKRTGVHSIEKVW